MKNIIHSENNTIPIPILKHFRCDGFDMKVITREGLVALLEKSKPTGSESYEVVVLRILPAEIIHGTDYPAREAMPTSESWGERGWTYRDRSEANEKMANFIQEGHFQGEGLTATASEPSKATFTPWAQPDLFLTLPPARVVAACGGARRRQPSE